MGYLLKFDIDVYLFMNFNTASKSVGMEFIHMTHPHPLIHPTFCYMHVLISYNVAYVQHEINTTKFELSLDMLFFFFIRNQISN